jgi:hypothetical protein
MFIPVVTGALGIVTKGVKKNLEAIQGKHSIDSLQNTSYARNMIHSMVSIAD